MIIIAELFVANLSIIDNKAIRLTIKYKQLFLELLLAFFTNRKPKSGL